MASTKAVSLLLILLSGHVIVRGRRVGTKKQVMQLNENEASHSKQGWGFPWSIHPVCFGSTLSTREYHFDVDFNLDGDKDSEHQDCADGKCMAIRLVRDADDPKLEFHVGKEWLVNKNVEGDELEFELHTPSDNSSVERPTDPQEPTSIISLADVDMIKLTDHGDTPDKLEIVIDSGNTFYMLGGLYYDEELLLLGLDIINKDKEIEEKLKERLQELVVVKQPDNVTGFVETEAHATALSKSEFIAIGMVWGMYGAAAVTGVAVQSQALAGATMLAAVGGLPGLLLMAAVLLDITPPGSPNAMLQTESTKTQATDSLPSAGRKIYEKLRCIPHFKECCNYNVLVPVAKECPAAVDCPASTMSG